MPWDEFHLLRRLCLGIPITSQGFFRDAILSEFRVLAFLMVFCARDEVSL
jgi:hypothetical protein